MTDPMSVTPPVLDDDNGRRGGIRGVEIGIFVLLLVVMATQTVYLLFYSRTLRESQDALICQWQVTTQLRNAANLERQAQREVISLAGNQDLSEEERKVRGRIALQNWLDALNKADADRAAVPLCPDPRNPD